ncbi:uncharacterized protein LOC129790396 [Lutzomyia longipalpis]|uniref:COMM domain-containing protein n=1 Tax=Lutzomyia longipalpis TaxID=7200 RepID=A0A1B0CFK3_LUTLO|nr:uncharacterized protein LOC129790396 [Lutzomyia longipalpis]
MHEISLNIDNVELLTEFLNNVITTEVTGGKVLKSWKIFGFSHQDEFDLAKKSLINIITQYCRAQIDQGTLKLYFSYLNPELQERALGIIESRKEEFLRHLIFASISIDQKAMESFDWDVKWILGSSSSSTVQKLITSLTLSCRKGKESPQKLHVEMDKEHLDRLIAALEHCERHLGEQ